MEVKIHFYLLGESVFPEFDDMRETYLTATTSTLNYDFILEREKTLKFGVLINSVEEDDSFEITAISFTIVG